MRPIDSNGGGGKEGGEQKFIFNHEEIKKGGRTSLAALKMGGKLPQGARKERYHPQREVLAESGGGRDVRKQRAREQEIEKGRLSYKKEKEDCWGGSVNGARLAGRKRMLLWRALKVVIVGGGEGRRKLSWRVQGECDVDSAKRQR